MQLLTPGIENKGDLWVQLLAYYKSLLIDQLKTSKMTTKAELTTCMLFFSVLKVHFFHWDYKVIIIGCYFILVIFKRPHSCWFQTSCECFSFSICRPEVKYTSPVFSPIHSTILPMSQHPFLSFRVTASDWSFLKV